MDISIRKLTADSGHGDPPPKHPNDVPAEAETNETDVEDDEV